MLQSRPLGHRSRPRDNSPFSLRRIVTDYESELAILQTQYTEKGFKKAENSEQRNVRNWVTFLITHVFTYVFVTLSILQSQFIETGFKKADNSEQTVVLLSFLFTLNKL